jgi:hypothetical protein
MTLKVKRCCKDIPIESYKLNDRGTIDLENDPEYLTVWPDVKYCMYCAKPLELEPE